MESFDCRLERLATDEPHRVMRPAVLGRSQPVNGHDPRMFQAAGDLCLARTARGCHIVGEPFVQSFEGDFPVDFPILRNVDLAQPAPGMRPQNLEPQFQDAGATIGSVVCCVGFPGTIAARRTRLALTSGSAN